MEQEKAINNIPTQQESVMQPDGEQIHPTTDVAESLLGNEASETADNAFESAKQVSEAFAMGNDAIQNIPDEDEQELKQKIAKYQERESKKKRTRRYLRKQKRMQKILDASADHDIRYRGILSYRSLRILAWFCIVAAQVGLLLAGGAHFDAGLARKLGIWPGFLRTLGDFTTPLFLMAAFSIILNNSRKFSSMLILYGGFSVVVYCLFLLIYNRYLVGMISIMGEMTKEEASALLEMLLSTFTENGFLSFNIFIDLFVCTLFTCFVVYRPKRFFVGKKVVFFRLLAILPAAYEIGCIIVKLLATFDVIIMSPYVYPLLTTKPPMTFLLFVAITFFIKKREWLYRRNGKSHEQYNEFLNTRLNSLQFSVFASIQFVAIALLDLLVGVIILIVFAIKSGDAGFDSAMQIIKTVGAGETLPLLGMIPIMMFFSYTRRHKDTKMDLIINLLGIIAVILVYMEGGYQYITRGYKMFLG